MLNYKEVAIFMCLLKNIELVKQTIKVLKNMSNLVASVFPTVSSGVLLGSITGIIKNHILAKLPKNYIKYTYIKNSFSSITEDGLSDDEALVKSKPALSIGLNYTWNDVDSSDGDSFKWGMSRIPVGAWQYAHIYRKIIVNEQDRFFLSAIDERLKLTYEIGIKLNSETQAYNLLGFVRSYIGVNRPYYINSVDVEIPIPFESLDLLITRVGLNVSTNEGKLAFHDYISRWSGGRVTYKKNLSSGNYNYFLKYNCNILCKIPEIPSIEKNMEGKSVLSADLKWNIELEFPYFTNFIAEHEILDLTMPEIPTQGLSPGNQGDSAIYNFTTRLPITRQLGNKSIALTTEFLTSLNGVIDNTNFKDVLSNDIVFFIENCKNGLVSNTNVITNNLKITLIRDNDLMIEGTDYEINWNTYDIIILGPWANYVYRASLYIDLVEYNKLIMLRNSLEVNQNNPVKKIVEINR